MVTQRLIASNISTGYFNTQFIHLFAVDFSGVREKFTISWKCIRAFISFIYCLRFSHHFQLEVFDWAISNLLNVSEPVLVMSKIG